MTAISLMKVFVITFVLLKTVSISADLITTPDGRKYLFEKNPKYNWMRAMHSCALSNGELITFNSKEELDEIVDILKANYDSTPDIWLGGHDRFSDEEDYHRRWWSVGGQQLTFFNWGKSDPNNGRKVEHCMVMRDSASNFAWVDVDCNTPRGYICDLNIECYVGCEESNDSGTNSWGYWFSSIKQKFMNLL